MKTTELDCELVSWEQVHDFAYRLALDIKASGFRPDLIVAVARGGYVPARLLCDFLHVYELASIRVEHYTGGACRQKMARLKNPLSLDPAGMRVLIVDDVCDTGDTYVVALEHLSDFETVEVRTAALQHKKESCYEPHYVAEYVKIWRWIIYPWAVTEDVTGFIEAMQDRPESLDALAAKLYEAHHIRLSRQRLEEILSLMQAGRDAADEHLQVKR